jgi:hypothetical protein
MFESSLRNPLDPHRPGPASRGRVGGVGDPSGSAVECALDGMWECVWASSCPDWVDRDWYGCGVTEDVERLVALPPGRALVTALTRIVNAEGAWVACGVDHEGEQPPGCPAPGRSVGSPCVCQIILAVAWDAIAGWGAGQASAALVAAVGQSPKVLPASGLAPGITDPCVDDVAVSLRISPDSARSRVTNARALCRQEPLLQLVLSGAMSPWAARSVLAETVGLSDEATAEVVRQVARIVRLRLVSGRRALSAGDVRRHARNSRVRLPESEQGPAREAARAGRRVTLRPDGNGMAWLGALLPEIPAARIMGRLSALANGLDDPERTLDQKRADVLCDTLLAPAQGTGPDSDPAAGSHCDQAESRGSVPASGAAPSSVPEINVIIDLATLLGLAENPGTIPGLGDIAATEARELAADGRWRAWITDATAATRTRPAGAGPGTGLSHAGLPPKIGTLRPRPRNSLARRRHGSGESRPSLPPPPHSEDPLRLCPGEPATRIRHGPSDLGLADSPRNQQMV